MDGIFLKVDSRGFFIFDAASRGWRRPHCPIDRGFGTRAFRLFDIPYLNNQTEGKESEGEPSE